MGERAIPRRTGRVGRPLPVLQVVVLLYIAQVVVFL
jgi:hypothetical protein